MVEHIVFLLSGVVIGMAMMYSMSSSFDEEEIIEKELEKRRKRVKNTNIIIKENKIVSHVNEESRETRMIPKMWFSLNEISWKERNRGLTDDEMNALNTAIQKINQRNKKQIDSTNITSFGVYHEMVKAIQENREFTIF